MNQYRVIVTELHSAEYHVDARTESEAHTLVINDLAGEPVKSWYNETMGDEVDAYIVEMENDHPLTKWDEGQMYNIEQDEVITQGDKKLKDYLERQEFFNDTEN